MSADIAVAPAAPAAAAVVTEPDAPAAPAAAAAPAAPNNVPAAPASAEDMPANVAGSLSPDGTPPGAKPSDGYSKQASAGIVENTPPPSETGAAAPETTADPTKPPLPLRAKPAAAHATAQPAEPIAAADDQQAIVETPSGHLTGQALAVTRAADQALSAPAASTGIAHGIPDAPAETAFVPLAGLALEIAARAQSGKHRFEIRLDPPELGRIDVRLDVDRHGQVTSRLVVERAETLDLLRRDAAGLERALQDAGLKTGDNGLQFSLRDQGLARQDDRQAPPSMARVFIPDSDAAAAETITYGRTPGTGGGLDIRV
jgi:hypothetical protein